uniref:Uncharacterized protein n=1 Tax=uncultured delta proteobacterium HF0200_39L23 TaxID=710832 RepID=E0XXY5_9DELT|nr:hypothetical protein [uncultured delta proteobacterium HF0200_39L23]
MRVLWLAGNTIFIVSIFADRIRESIIDRETFRSLPGSGERPILILSNLAIR